jgi:hypothetical protein
MSGFMMSSMFSGSTRPHFSGDPNDWPTFVSDWETYMSLMRGMAPNVPDLMLFESLKQSLDISTQREMQQAREANPTLRYDDFWAQLNGNLSRDTPQLQRRAWEAVRLRVSGPKLTLADWRDYRSDFELKLARVYDRNETEEYTNIFGTTTF